MSSNILKSNYFRILSGLTIAISIVFESQIIFEFKKIFFIFFSIITIYFLCLKIQKKNQLYIFNYSIIFNSLCFILFSYSIIVMIFLRNYIDINLIKYSSYLFIGFYLFYFDIFKINFAKYLNLTLICHQILTVIFFFILNFYYKEQVSDGRFDNIRYQLELLEIFVWQSKFFKENFYFVSPTISPLYIFSFIYSLREYIKKKNDSWILFCLLSIFSLLISGTRGEIILSIFLFSVLIFNVIRNYYICSGFFFLCLLLFFNLEFFSLEDYSNKTKINYLYDYYLIFLDLNNFIFGQGVGFNHYWLTQNRFSPSMEITYLEVLRWYGLIGFTVFTIIIFFPVYIFLYNENNNYSLILVYAFFLIYNFTNPNLYNSVGFTLIIAIINLINSKRYEN